MTLSALGIFSAAGAGGVAFASDYELIESVILTGSQASITFSSLGTYSSTYKHLQIRMIARDARAVDINNAFLRFNGDTTTNYSYHLLVGNGSTVTSDAGVSNDSAVAGGSVGASGTANAFAPSVVDILDPFSTTKNKTVRSLTGQNSSASTIRLWSSNWRSTASVTSINIYPSSSTGFVSGSRFSLYGLK